METVPHQLVKPSIREDFPQQIVVKRYIPRLWYVVESPVAGEKNGIVESGGHRPEDVSVWDPASVAFNEDDSVD